MILGHCHAGPPGHFRRIAAEYPEDFGQLDQLARYTGELGYGSAVVFAPFQRWFDGDPNAWLLDAVRGDARFVPWVTLNGCGPEAARDLEAKIAAGARGIKLHPPVARIAIDDPGLAPVWAVAEAARLPVLIHTGPHGWFLNRYRPMLVDEVAQRYPKLPLIVEHLGGAAFVNETFAVLANNRNVYGGLATCLPADATWHVPAAEVGRLVRAFGADRFVFGADFPYNDVATNFRALEVLKGLGLPAADLGLVASGNLERLLEGAARPS